MLQKLREYLTLLLLGLLPFHALLVTAGTRIILGPGHAPLTVLALWKEALLALILLIAIIELLPTLQALFRHIDLLDGLIISLVVLSVVVQFLIAPRPLGEFILGARYDCIPLIAFLILRRVPWSEWFKSFLPKIILIVGGVIAAIGIVSFLLPLKFFVWLGYSDLHSLYIPNQPLAPYQQIGESWVRRVQSTMSGPNQLGVWLLLPLSVVLYEGIRRIRGNRGIRGVFGGWWMYLFLLLGAALFLTFSRAAWIAAFVMVMVTLARVLPRRMFKRAIIGTVALMIVVGIAATALFPSVFFRLSSSRGHLTRPLQAIGQMVRHPLGQGLGSAGPATNRGREPCVFLRPQDDPSWAKSQPELCVFLGTNQVQPLDHPCNCPFLPENWYLQIGVELGWIGFALFVALTMLVLRRLGLASEQDARSRVFTALFFLGVSIAALFLHAWEDASVAYSGWLLMGICQPVCPSRKGA